MKKLFLVMLTVMLFVSVKVQAQPQSYMIDTVLTVWKVDTLLANNGTHTQIFNHGSGILYYAGNKADTSVADSKYRSKFLAIPSGKDQYFDVVIPSIFFFKSSGSSAIEIVRW